MYLLYPDFIRYLIFFHILGIDITRLTGDSSAVDDSLEHLVRTHKELVSVKIGRSNCTDRGFQAVMSNPNIVVLKFYNRFC